MNAVRDRLFSIRRTLVSLDPETVALGLVVLLGLVILVVVASCSPSLGR